MKTDIRQLLTPKTDSIPDYAFIEALQSAIPGRKTNCASADMRTSSLDTASWDSLYYDVPTIRTRGNRYFTAWATLLIKTVLLLASFSLSAADVVIIEGKTANRTAQTLDLISVDYARMSYQQLETGGIAGSKYVIIPNKLPSSLAMDRLEDYNGKIIALATGWWGHGARLFNLLGIKAVKKTRLTGPRTYTINGLPIKFNESTWFAREEFIPDVDAISLGEWDNSTSPAILENPRGYYITHLMQSASIDHNAQLLQYLLENVPSSVPELSIGLLNQVDNASAWIDRAKLQKKYAKKQKTTNNYKAAWVRSGDWLKIAEILDEVGFDTVIGLMTTGGAANYPSVYLPSSNEYKKRGDQLEQFVTSTHDKKMQAHAWMSTWSTRGAPKIFIDSMRVQNRLQVDKNGNEMTWLSPCNDLNRKLVYNVLLEMASNYKVDGIQLDFMRINTNYSYDISCRNKYESNRGIVQNWPYDVSNGYLKKDYMFFLTGQISSFVREAYTGIKFINPSIVVSSAALKDFNPNNKQDWQAWARDGYIDAIYRLTYTPDLAQFKNMAAQTATGNSVPVYLGINTNMQPVDKVIDQMQVVKDMDGFSLFQMDNSTLENYLPLL